MKSRFFIYLLPLVGVVMFYSCGGSSSSVSSTTGWNYNSTEHGGFEVVLDYDQQTGPGLVFVQGGTYTMGVCEQDVNYRYNNVTKRVTVSSFYMDETEVRNVDYREYLHWLGRVFIDYPEVKKQATPDTLVWRSVLGYNEPYVEYYFRHPAYNDYPVVGVSWVQARDYCLWRTDRVNELILINKGIIDIEDLKNQIGEQNFNTDAYLAGQYEPIVKQNLPSLEPDKEERRVRFEDGLLLPKYRLPSESEWEYAAKALIGNTYEERIYEKRIYPWNGHNVRNDSRQYLGQMRANFRRGRGDFMGVAGDLNDNAEITASVKSYWPNDFGLYNMAGNVSEWVLDVYRPLSFEDVDEFRPFRGNVFKKQELDEDGNIAPKDSLGRLKWTEITEEDAMDRENYQKSDYRNYLDGDKESSLLFKDETLLDEDFTSNTYTQDIANLDVNSLINDETRVIKGGSWKDRAYYLSPGTRRFMNQNKSASDLGFRCAMDRMGSPSGF